MPTGTHVPLPTVELSRVFQGECGEIHGAKTRGSVLNACPVIIGALISPVLGGSAWQADCTLPGIEAQKGP
jgi:hypothetical protein